MDVSLRIVIFALCLHHAWCSVDTYTAAYVREDVKVENFNGLIYEASKLNADILVLPSPGLPSLDNLDKVCSADKNDQIIKTISDASKKGKLYVVLHTLEKMRCENQQEIVKNNFVFDRDGSIIAVKPLGSTKCNITNTAVSTFTTDFGVTFGLLMEEDLVLKNTEDMYGIKNFVLTGNSKANIPYLSANEFSSSWSYATNANLVSSKGIFAGRSGLKTGNGKLVLPKLHVAGGEDQSIINFKGQTALTNFPGEDLSQYTIRPLDIEASVHGYRETVCHDSFCCDFHLKTRFLGNPKEVNYGLVVFSGVQNYDDQNSIGMQSCMILACAGLYKRSCFLSSENTTNVMFEKLSISGNFSSNSAQFPIINSIEDNTIDAEQLRVTKHATNTQVNADLYHMKDILRFGIVSRDYSKDFESVFVQNKTQVPSEYSDYISSENVEEFFDYLWIRLRVLIFVASIYILEML